MRNCRRTSSRDHRLEFNRDKLRGFTIKNFLIAVAIFLTLIALLLPAVRTAGSAARRAQCKNNLKQIGLALDNYHDTYSAFPPAYTVDADGKPLHSWRTLILPFLNQVALYNTIDLSKPWDDPANSVAFNTRVVEFNCPSANILSTQSTYLGITSINGFFHSTGKQRNKSEITDLPSQTLMVVEVAPDQAVHWMAPVDADESLVLEVRKNPKILHPRGANALMVDGSVLFMSDDLTAEQLRALISINGNEHDVKFE